MNRLLSSLGLCRKAGKLVLGFDGVKGAILDGSAQLVLLSSDLSQKTRKEVLFHAQQQHRPVLQTGLTMEEVQSVFRKKCGVFALTDPGFAAMIRKQIAANEEVVG